MGTDKTIRRVTNPKAQRLETYRYWRSRTCAERMKRVRETIEGHFPLGTKVHPPEGGTLLWVQLPESLDAGSLHEKALRDGIAIVPGSLFTMGDRYRNCFRLNGTFWSERIDQALRSLGGLAVSSRTG